MRKVRIATIIAFIQLLVLSMMFTLHAAWAMPPVMMAPSGLSFLELKATGNEFLVLQNNSNTAINNLSAYWLTAYNNANPLANGVTSSSQQLPIVGLQAGQTLLLSAEPAETCGASVAGELSLSLGDASGFLQISQMSISPKGAATQTPGDMVSWSSGAAGLIQNMPSNTKAPKAAYYRYLNENSYAWQQAELDTVQSCQLNIVVAGGSGSSSAVTPLTLAATSPPATILGTVTSGDDAIVPVLPAADVGLQAPQISELLPNPTGTGNDETDEFIELYNPNSKQFDLTGFILQTGLSTARNYTFPAGSTIEPQSFKAFYSRDTKLGLSNTTSQAALLDPFGNAISVSDTYKTAKDGLTWVNAKNKWYWTTQPTPNAANIVKQPVVKKAKAKSSKSKIAVAKSSTANTASNNGAGTASAFGEEEVPAGAVHTWVLALIAGIALLYGTYEYRHDIINRSYQLRAKLSTRRAASAQSKGQRSD